MNTGLRVYDRRSASSDETGHGRGEALARVRRASATTRRPARRAAREVSGPIETTGRRRRQRRERPRGRRRREDDEVARPGTPPAGARACGRAGRSRRRARPAAACARPRPPRTAPARGRGSSASSPSCGRDGRHEVGAAGAPRPLPARSPRRAASAAQRGAQLARAVRARDDDPVVAETSIGSSPSGSIAISGQWTTSWPSRSSLPTRSCSWPAGRVTTIFIASERQAARPRGRPDRCPSGARSRSRPRPRSAPSGRRRRGGRPPGARQPPPISATQRRSASTRACVSGVVDAARRDPPRRPGPAARARPAPPPAASPTGSIRSPISPPRPKRSRPQAASTMASRPRSPRLRRRVSMLPRSGSIESVGSSASSWARRRADAVPIRIPGRIASAPQRASRGSSRCV